MQVLEEIMVTLISLDVSSALFSNEIYRIIVAFCDCASYVMFDFCLGEFSQFWNSRQMFDNTIRSATHISIAIFARSKRLVTKAWQRFIVAVEESSWAGPENVYEFL